MSLAPERLPEALWIILQGFKQRGGRLCVLTGAGISAESGIPTFRGTEGYWRVGSSNYVPERMATHEMFSHYPDEVWRWYLMRFGRCRDAQPNAGHLALVALEQTLGDRFRLVTQNIDGLHRRAGSSDERCFAIHGDAAWVRCSSECGVGRLAAPELAVRDSLEPFTQVELLQLHCPSCGSWLRPHVLWFDEYYDELNYRADSALRAAGAADLLITVGTSGATSLPMQIGELCLRTGAAILDINPEANPFGMLAQQARRGFFAQGAANDWLPRIAAALA